MMDDHRPLVAQYQAGAALVVALILLLMLTVLGVSTMSTARMEMRSAANHRLRETAFQLAETGIETAIRQFGAKGDAPAPGATDCPATGTVTLNATTAVPELQGSFRVGTGFCGETPDFSGGSSLGKISQFHFRTDSRGITQSGGESLNRQGFFVRGPAQY